MMVTAMRSQEWMHGAQSLEIQKEELLNASSLAQVSGDSLKPAS